MSTPQPTSTFTPSPTPFPLYGKTLTDVTYCTPDHLPQKLDIYFPEAGGPWHVVVYVHGGAWMTGDKSDALDLKGGMNKRGYLVVSINYRLYPSAKFPDMIEDAKCAVRFLRAHAGEYNLDPQRIAAMGASAGGHLVALLGTAGQSAGWDVGEYLDQSSRVQAVVVFAGPADLTRPYPEYLTSTLRDIFGEGQLVSGSPVTYVSPDDPPFLIIHGQLDPVVPVEQGLILYERLTEAGVPARLIIVDHANHAFVGVDGEMSPSWDELNQVLLTFWDQNLH